MTTTKLELRVQALEEEVAALRDELESQRVSEGIRKGLEQVAQGKVTPAREFLEKMRVKHKISRP